MSDRPIDSVHAAATAPRQMTLGALYLGDDRCRFRVWAPRATTVQLHLRSPQERLVTLEPREWGYHEIELAGVPVGSRYSFRLSGGPDRPDPASQYQPDGVHEPSEVVDPTFSWNDSAWRGLDLQNYILYELHIGTFTPQGTFAAAIDCLDHIVDLGASAVEILPVAQFPGSRNWGYDGVHPFAVQNTYGRPEDLKRLVDACHQRGLAVVLDVVYNHLGPEGNYFGEFGPYFSQRYRIGWGEALNFDGRDSDPVREFFIDNVLFWVTEFHIDALRMDAVHAIYDSSAEHILAEMATGVRTQSDRLGRQIYLMPESGQNNPRLTERVKQGGYGLDAEWNEDFHRSLHALLTGERNGYYGDYGTLTHLAKAYSHGFVFDGQYVKYRRRRYGRSSLATPAQRFIVFSQNHDQTGNRPHGERLGQLVDFESQKLAAAAVLLSPFIPLVFMGEEYGDNAPFLYFISHLDPTLVEAVRSGRRQDFAGFEWGKEIVDPQAIETFERSRLDHSLREQGQHAVLLEYYRTLIRLRKTLPALRNLSKSDMRVIVDEQQQVLTLHRSVADAATACVVLNFARSVSTVTLPSTDHRWTLELDSASGRWNGPGESSLDASPSESCSARLAPRSVLLLTEIQ